MIQDFFNFALLSVKPSLKKVSKYDNKFAKLQKKAAEFNFRQNLKVVKKKEFSMTEEDLGVSSSNLGHVHLVNKYCNIRGYDNIQC